MENNNKNGAKEKVEKIASKKAQEQENAQKRFDSAKVKKDKKEKEEKQKAQRKQAKLERKKELQEEKKKNQLLKERVKKAKEAKKTEAKRVKLAKKVEERRVKQAQKQQRIAERKERKKSGKRSGAMSGWIASVVTLGTLCLILATTLTINMMGGNVKMATTQLQQTYNKSFSDLVDYVDNIDINLSKVLVASDKGQQQKLLVKISEESALAEYALEELPIVYENKNSTAKFINQVGDYSKYLNNRLIDGYSISQEEYDNLQKLYDINVDLKDNLLKINNMLNGKMTVRELFDGAEAIGNITFADMQARSVDYPKLIYDGPFSDGLLDKVVKGLTGNEITKKEAEEVFKKAFSKHNFSMTEVVGETAGRYECFNVLAQDDMGVEVFAQISKKGGKVIEFSYPKQCNVGELAEEDCINAGLEFLASLGIKNMKPVWSETNDKMLTVNYAYEQDGVIVYSDLIKLNICREKAQVFGMEAKSYYLNHQTRDIGTAKLDKSTAVTKCGNHIDIDVESARLAFIPYGNSKEILTYELSGEHNGATYFVYIDANSGCEVEIFKVIEGDNGNLLI